MPVPLVLLTECVCVVLGGGSEAVYGAWPLTATPKHYTIYTASQAYRVATMYFSWCCQQRGWGLSAQQGGIC